MTSLSKAQTDFAVSLRFQLIMNVYIYTILEYIKHLIHKESHISIYMVIIYNVKYETIVKL